ncbi:putative ubiquitin-protein ligase UBR2 KNAG_0B05080 [Huiozyma naganishii CBS 8797]|uniref:E3 ubiquitin-protein ligase n=1 Tax=Huiozyma naganishii (strain ATCC MYA-139 / BCRC 22969 / CBS 8797 / KCTC 17520 / NBRC 10181 / NCYC 3082 / Yp74L-3) TaxID=1071383 RepID=J7S530_HUIN7|nr:hypothetical protein KNAG_0B05080 [Kazachstania naganishii CBS 8797]CCK68941.1 hypothetical protein KNAG_0B05080 [Kazachstania naganishii CBS 8797]
MEVYKHRRIPETLRDFLTYLPGICSNEYNELVSYVLWKTVTLCVSNSNHSIQWRSIIENLDDIRTNKSKYNNLLPNSEWRKQFFDEPPESHHDGFMCSRDCFAFETVYYCFTCTTNPFDEICDYCFDKEQHIGHDYTAKIVIRSEGRVCHCGDSAAFKIAKNAYKCKASSHNKARPTERVNSEDVQGAIGDILDYIIENMKRTKNWKMRNKATVEFDDVEQGIDSVVPGTGDNDNANLGNTTIPNGNVKLRDSFENLCDMVYSQYASNRNLEEKWALQIDNEDLVTYSVDLVSKLTRILNKPVEYATSIITALENDTSPVTVLESQDYSKLEKIRQLFYKEGITMNIRRMHDLFKIYLIQDLIDWLYTFSRSKINCHDVKAAIRCAMLCPWRAKEPPSEYDSLSPDPMVNEINLFGGFLVSGKQDTTNPWFTPWNFTDIDDQRISQIMVEYNINLVQGTTSEFLTHFYTIHGSRFQHILTECTSHLTKTASFRIVNVLCSLFTITDNIRKCLAAQYFDVYLTLLYDTVASDKGQTKVSLISLLSQYTFQNPSFANMAIESGFIERTLKFAYTLMAFRPKDLTSCLPVSLYDGFKLPSGAIRNRRTIICFKDICVLLSTHTAPKELLEREPIFDGIINAFTEFNNVLPLKRETMEHVEYENFEFSSFYFFFSSILIMTDGYIRSISMLTDKELKASIVMKLLKVAISKEFELLGNFRKNVSIPFIPSQPLAETSGSLKSDLLTMKEKICNHEATTINFKVGVDIQNFFNPMSYLFKFVLVWARCGRFSPLPSELRDCIDFSSIFKKKEDALYISESALSTLVLLGQINTGFWVRNGTPITHQARMYTKYSMREYAYVSDIYNVQFSMCMGNPNDFMVTYLSRWGLKNWANGFPMGDYPEEGTVVAIVNECLLLLIQLLTELKSLVAISAEESFKMTLKSEIIHSICFSSVSYSQIIENTPEHVAKHAAFDSHLELYTNYTPPSGLVDVGYFTLKDEYLAEINPYYFGLAQSKRYEVEKKMRDNMAQAKDIRYEDTFIPAMRVIDVLLDTPYAGLYSITSEDTFGAFLKSTLDHITKFKYDVLLPRIIHLIHLAVVNNLNDFTKVFWHEYAIADTEFCHYHSIGSLLYSFLLIDDFSVVHGKIREIFRYLHHTAPHIDVDSYLNEQTLSYNAEVVWSGGQVNIVKDEALLKKKMKAKLRTEKLLQKFARQQARFMENNTNDVRSDEDVNMESPGNSRATFVSMDTTDPTYWNFPDDHCALCKMPKESDPFVYFSYQEYNICDNDVNFNNSGSVKKLFWPEKEAKRSSLGHIDKRHVIRACGHGAHIKCLGNHMKSKREVHTQATKNIPCSFGYGLLYCPVCNSLGNSFLPNTQDYQKRCLNDFFSIRSTPAGDVYDDRSGSIAVRDKATMIFMKLSGYNEPYGGNSYGTLNMLVVNTVFNLELRLRSRFLDKQAIITRPKISNQCLMTLRLLMELKSQVFLAGAYSYRPLEDAIFFEKNDKNCWDLFASNICGENLLLCVSTMLENAGGLKVVGNACLLRVLKLKFFQDFSSLMLNLKDSNLVELLSKSESYSLDAVRKRYGSSFDQEGFTTMELLLRDFMSLTDSSGLQVPVETFKYHIYDIMKKGITVFLRRVYILFLARYPDFENSIDEPQIDETDYYVRGLKLPGVSSFSNFLKIYMLDMNDILQNKPLVRTFNELKGVKSEIPSFPCPERIYLLNLPHKLSDIVLELERADTGKYLRTEPAVCLFCGEVKNIQGHVVQTMYRMGECTDHVRNECAAMSTFGVFLIVKTNMLYISYGERGTFFPTPYMNKYGDSDVEFKFATPVYLDADRYDALSNDLILGNMVPHIVFCRTDCNADLGGWETL